MSSIDPARRETPGRRPASGLVLALALWCAPSAATVSSAQPHSGDFDLHVAPWGDDVNSGVHWSRPLKTIQRAVDLAQPGQRVAIHAGEYREDIRSVRDGRPEAPIALLGAAGATVRGAGHPHVIEIRHSYIELVNLAVDGAVSEPGGKRVVRDKLVYVVGRSEQAGVTGVRLLHMQLRNAGGECVRLKYFARHNEVAFSTITGCGARDFHGGGDGKNGEGIYIGTAPEQLHRNPSSRLDGSNGNWIHHNYIDTRGNECVDIKEASRFNVIEYNACTGQLDEDAAGVSSRGNDNIVRFNSIWGNRGAGIRFGGDTASDGIDNHAYGNQLGDNAYSAFKIMAWPQRRICGNRLSGSTVASVRGPHARKVDPASACP